MDITLERIIEELKIQNKKQIDLTNFLGLTHNNFRNWENGRNTSYLKYLHAIANYPATPAIDESPHFCGLFALLSRLRVFLYFIKLEIFSKFLNKTSHF